MKYPTLTAAMSAYKLGEEVQIGLDAYVQLRAGAAHYTFCACSNQNCNHVTHSAWPLRVYPVERGESLIRQAYSPRCLQRCDWL